jgi:magnesium transporter
LPAMVRSGRIPLTELPQFTLAASVALSAVATTGAVAGGLLPFLTRALSGRSHRSSAPLVSVVVDALGVLVYYAVALAVLHAGGS